MTADLLVTNCFIATPSGRTTSPNSIAVNDGMIAGIGELDRLPDADTVIDGDGNTLVPGIIDTHVHQREPGYEHREDFVTATRAAAAGGITSIFTMPNTDPVIDNVDTLRDVYEIGDEKSIVDFQVYGYLSPENIDQIDPLANEGVIAFKGYLGVSATGLPIFDDGAMIEAMEHVAETGKRFAFHAENNEIIKHLEAQFKESGMNSALDHAHSRPVIAEREAISRILLFAQHTECPVTIVHLGSGSGAQMIAHAKQHRAIDVVAETCPQYLWFDETVLEEKGNYGRINPPIRSADEQQALWEIGIHGTGIDYIGTDHSPHTDEAKGADDPFMNTWDANSGFVGIETQVPAMLTFVNQGRLSLEHWIEMHSTRPAQLYGIYPQKGSLQIGTHADFTIVDLDSEWTVDRHDLHSKSTVTPFDGETFTGKVTHTIVRGTVVYETGSVTGEPGYGRVIETT